METFLEIILLIFGILQIILFFKLWGMTNDVKKIKEKLLSTDPDKPNLKNNTERTFQEGIIVVDLKTDKQMKVGELLNNGRYRCYSGSIPVGDFESSEIVDFDYWKDNIYKK